MLQVRGKDVLIIYAVVIALTAFYLAYIEFGARAFELLGGGRDTQFTFFDATLILVLLVSSALTAIATSAYNRKGTERLFFVAFAFFLFSLKSALKIVENFMVGSYGYLGISIQTLELLILLSLFYALLRK